MSFVFALLLLLASAVAGQNFRGLSVSFDAPVIPVSRQPIRIVYRGTNFSEYTAFRLTQNTTNCNQGVGYAVGSTPPGTISNIVYWTKFDPSNFMAAQFWITSSGEQIRACFTRDGSRWFTAANNRGRRHFRVWNIAPTITAIIPPTPIAGQRVELKVPQLSSFAVGALVNRRDGCDGTTIANAIRASNFTRYNAASQSFTFTPTASATQAYLCVATTVARGDWSLIPFDPQGVVKFAFTPSQPPSGILPRYYGNFTINPSRVAYLRGEILCNSVVAGARVTCTVRIVNKTVSSISTTDFSFIRLTDGGGATICPFPRFVAVAGSSTRVSFTFLPQRSGRGGSLALSYKGFPLWIYSNPLNDAVYAIPKVFNTSVAPVKPDFTRDQTVMRFIVQPGFSDMQVYGYQSLLNFAYFAPAANWRFTKGVPTSVNGSTGQDVIAATLATGIVSGTMSRSTAIPSGSTMCRVFTKYFYSADQGPDYTQTALVGTITVTVGTNVASTINLYASGTRVGVVGALRRGNLVGDMRTWETVGLEFPVNSTQGTVTVALSAYHGSVSKMYFSGTEMRCSSAVRTLPAEVAALQRIWTYVGQQSPRLADWRDGTTFNGDPCVNQWQGVVCRNLRVVELNLDSALLRGVFPQLEELILLERLSLRNNSLRGAIPSHLSNLTSLRYVDLSLNQFSGGASPLFTAGTHVCLQTLILRQNELTKFPRQVVNLPNLLHLDLASNSIASGMPSWPPAAPLIYLDVSRNSISGPLPNLPEQRLVSADFSGNRFNGTVPQQWANLQQVRFVDISTNQLAGVIPLQLSVIRTAPKITFRAASNFFTGYLPNLGFLVVDVRDNVFKCPLPIGKSFLLTSHQKGYEAIQCDAAQQ